MSAMFNNVNYISWNCSVNKQIHQPFENAFYDDIGYYNEIKHSVTFNKCYYDLHSNSRNLILVSRCTIIQLDKKKIILLKLFL